MRQLPIQSSNHIPPDWVCWYSFCMLKNTVKSGLTLGDTSRIGTHPQLSQALLAQLLECGESGGSVFHSQNVP